MFTKRYFSCTSVGHTTVVHWDEPCLIGDAIAEIAGLELREIIKADGPSVLVMDFSRVKAISSSMIGCLIRVQQQLRHTGGIVRFAAVSPSMESIFRTLNLLRESFRTSKEC